MKNACESGWTFDLRNRLKGDKNKIKAVKGTVENECDKEYDDCQKKI